MVRRPGCPYRFPKSSPDRRARNTSNQNTRSRQLRDAQSRYTDLRGLCMRAWLQDVHARQCNGISPICRISASNLKIHGGHVPRLAATPTGHQTSTYCSGLSHPHITHITDYTYFHIRKFISGDMQSELQPRVDRQRTTHTTPTPHMEMCMHFQTSAKDPCAHRMQRLFPHAKKSGYKHRPPPPD